MNVKRWLLASLAALIVMSVVGYVTHQILLADIYKQTASVWRPEADMKSLGWIMWVGSVIFALVFALIYVKGYESGKNVIGQGLRYGLYIGLLTAVAMQFTWYVVLPIPAALPVYWGIAGMAHNLLAGLAVGLIYKP